MYCKPIIYTALCCILFTICADQAFSQSQDRNYISSTTVRVAGLKDDAAVQAALNDKSKTQTTIQYADGLGRPLQTVQRMGSAAGNDIVTPNEYDLYGREIRKYMPYVPSVTSGAYQTNAITGVNSFYAAPPSGISLNTNPYAESMPEASGLARPVESGAPGSAWQLGSGHTIRYDYRLNNNVTWSADSVNSRQVAMYHVITNADNSRSLVRYNSAYYPDNSLTVTIMMDENWANGRAGTIEEYKDQDGRVVLKRTYNFKNPAVRLEALSTYYVYDDQGNLCYVLPPETNADGPGTPTQQNISDLGYEYWYDGLSRLFRRKLPGKGWEFLVYNTMDQIVMSQDANQRNKSPQEWTFTKYDALGRTAITGIYQQPGTSADATVITPYNGNFAALQNYYNTTTQPKWETRNNSTNTGYDNASDPGGNGYTFYAINFYDDYSAPVAIAPYSAPYGANLATRGLPTYQFSLVIGSANLLLCTKIYYDNDGRQLKSFKQHYLGGTFSYNNYDAFSTTYDFTGAVTTTSRQHFTSANTSTPLMTINNQYIYDHAGRRLKNWQQIYNGSNPTTRTLLSKVDYNQIGQMSNKWLHSTDSLNFYQQVAYTYNPRGWLKKINSALFEEELFYETGTNKSYNGNIMYQQWGTAGAPNTNSFSYRYDPINRLTSGAMTDNSFAEQAIEYDRNGNITALQRVMAATQVDNLTYNYGGTNQLQSISDGSGNNNGLKAGTWSLTNKYDPNGNLTADPSRGISAISYNTLNLPQSFTLAGSTISYTYDAAGNKLRRISTSGSGTTTEYIDGIQYTNSTSAVDFVQTEDGQALKDGASAYNYQYSLTDHLGNTRVVFDTKTGIAQQVQKDDYMPFGLQISRSTTSPPNKYLYNKKELQDEIGMYDYGARFYDPVMARWNTVDPKAENSRRWSPYVYAANNPIRFIDPDGMAWIEGTDGKAVSYTQNTDGTITWSKNASADTKEYGDALIAVGNKASLDKVINSNIKTHVIMSSATKEENTGDGKTLYTYGETIQGNNNESDNYGRVSNSDGSFGIKEATIIIYKGSIEAAREAGTGSKLEGLTQQQAIGAVSTHEDVHASNKQEINRDLKYEMSHGNQPRPDKETLPNAVEKRIIDAQKKLNNTQQ